MFSHFFVRRPIFASVISLVIVLIGTFSLKSLPVARYPEISPPTITVSALYPGADAQTVADTVASPIEEMVNGVENMIYMNSVSAGDGSYALTVTFETGTDLDTANVLTQNRVSSAQSKLPMEAQRMGVNVKKKSPDVILYIAVYSPDGSYDPLFLSNYVNLRMKDEIARAAGVGEVTVFGTGDYSMRIWLNPEQMRIRNISAGEVIQAVKDQNQQVAAGKVGEPPLQKGQAFTMNVNVQGRLVDPEEFGAIVLRTGEDGELLRLRDVARVELGAFAYTFDAKFNSAPCAAMAVYQIPGANALEVADGVNARLQELSKSFPEGLEYKTVYDNTDVIRASIEEVIVTLFITLLLVVLTVYIFLQNLRATLIPAITIPVALIGTFAIMAMIGFSINQFTLFGLVLVIGIVVDDAIVVVENCTRLIDGGMNPKEAAMQTMTEVSGPVIATTLVLLAVFIPTAFMAGITGRLFQQFAITISVATVFSSINALTLSPALCGVILLPSKGETRNPIFKAFNRLMDRSRDGYMGIVNVALRRVAIGILLFIGFIGLAGYGFTLLPSGFVPQEDEGYCMVNMQLPEAASQDRMNAFANQVNEVVKSVDGVEKYLTITGFSILDGSAVANSGFVVVVFKHWNDRDPEQHQTRILQDLNRNLSQLQDGVAFAFPAPSLPGVGISAGFSMMMQDRGGIGIPSLNELTTDFIADGNTQTALTGMSTPFRANVPQVKVDVDREQVMTKGVSVNAVYSALQSFLGGAYVNDFTLFNRVFKVKAQADSEFRAEPDQIGDFEIRHPNGDMIPLAAFVQIDEVLGPQTITRYNLSPAIKVMGQPAEGFSSGQAMDLIEHMAQEKLPSTVGFEWTELSYQEKAAQGSANIIFLLAVVLVYLVLAAQYESWSLPVSVCLAVPTALLGAVGGILLRGMDNNVYTQVGIVLLIGLSTKSAILIVEFAKSQHDAGLSLIEAAQDAAKLRFRAVLMTAFSFILGVIPLLIASGAGAESRKVLGTTVFFGMIVATVVSLVAVPMLYLAIARLSERSGKKGGAA